MVRTTTRLTLELNLLSPQVQALLYQCLVSWRRLSAAYHEAVGMDGKDFPTGNFVQLLRESLPEAALHVP